MKKSMSVRSVMDSQISESHSVMSVEMRNVIDRLSVSSRTISICSRSRGLESIEGFIMYSVVQSLRSQVSCQINSTIALSLLVSLTRSRSRRSSSRPIQISSERRLHSMRSNICLENSKSLDSRSDSRMQALSSMQMRSRFLVRFGGGDK